MRSFDDETIDNGLSVVKINDISPAIQEQVDLEIKRLLQVKCTFYMSHDIQFCCT